MPLRKISTVEEPAMSYGGKWTEQKLDAFMAYVRAYLAIMKQFPYWETIYFDGFAGSGERIKERKNLLIPFEDELPEELNVYKGSVKRVLEEKNNLFDFYYFIDKNPDNIKNIEKIRSEITHIKKDKIAVRESDCNEQLPKLAQVLKKGKHAALIFVDPFGMQINWNSIAGLKGTRSDIWILIPSGVAITRLLPRSGVITNKNKLEMFFGLPIDELRKIFYHDEVKTTLFGEMEQTKKLDKSIERITKLYASQMRNIWPHVSEPLTLKNTKNRTIFHLLFASNNKNALKIASEIISKRQK